MQAGYSRAGQAGRQAASQTGQDKAWQAGKTGQGKPWQAGWDRARKGRAGRASEGMAR